MSDQADAPTYSDLMARSFALDHVLATLSAASCNLDMIVQAIERCPEEDAGCTAIQWARAIQLVTQALDCTDDFATNWKKPGVLARKRT